MSFCGAIEMVKNPPTSFYATLLNYSLLQAGIITFSTSIIKRGVEKFALKQPIFLVKTYLFR